MTTLPPRDFAGSDCPTEATCIDYTLKDYIAGSTFHIQTNTNAAPSLQILLLDPPLHKDKMLPVLLLVPVAYGVLYVLT